MFCDSGELTNAAFSSDLTPCSCSSSTSSSSSFSSSNSKMSYCPIGWGGNNDCVSCPCCSEPDLSPSSSSPLTVLHYLHCHPPPPPSHLCWYFLCYWREQLKPVSNHFVSQLLTHLLLYLCPLFPFFFFSFFVTPLLSLGNAFKLPVYCSFSLCCDSPLCIWIPMNASENVIVLLVAFLSPAIFKERCESEKSTYWMSITAADSPVTIWRGCSSKQTSRLLNELGNWLAVASAHPFPPTAYVYRNRESYRLCCFPRSSFCPCTLLPSFSPSITLPWTDLSS